MSKVIGVGFHKTGTTSLGHAFRQLGMISTGWVIETAALYKRGHLDALLDISEDFDAFEDVPWYLLYKELYAKYPGSKLILTRRKDSETWYRSLVKHADRREDDPFSFRVPLYGFHDVEANRELAIKRYEDHMADVREFAAMNNAPLLELCWEDGDGWPELCAFLECDVPARPFPHANSAPTLQSRMKQRALRLIKS